MYVTDPVSHILKDSVNMGTKVDLFEGTIGLFVRNELLGESFSNSHVDDNADLQFLSPLI